VADEEDENSDRDPPDFDGEVMQGGEPTPDEDETTDELTGND